MERGWEGEGIDGGTGQWGVETGEEWGWRDGNVGMKTCIQTDMHANLKVGRQADMQTDRRTDRKAGRRTGLVRYIWEGE